MVAQAQFIAPDFNRWIVLPDNVDQLKSMIRERDQIISTQAKTIQVYEEKMGELLNVVQELQSNNEALLLEQNEIKEMLNLHLGQINSKIAVLEKENAYLQSKARFGLVTSIAGAVYVLYRLIH